MAVSISKICVAAAPFAVALFGCHCVEVSERYGDRVDAIADRQITFDQFYRPGLDLTRICRDCNHQNTRSQHPVVYPDSRWLLNASAQETTAPEMIPGVPPSELPPIDATEIQSLPQQNSNKDTSQMSTAIDSVLSIGQGLSTSQSIESAVLQTPPIQLTTASEEIVSPSVPLSSIPKINELDAANTMTKKETLPAKPVSAPAGVPPGPTFFLQYQR